MRSGLLNQFDIVKPSSRFCFEDCPRILLEQSHIFIWDKYYLGLKKESIILYITSVPSSFKMTSTCIYHSRLGEYVMVITYGLHALQQMEVKYVQWKVTNAIRKVKYVQHIL